MQQAPLSLIERREIGNNMFADVGVNCNNLSEEELDILGIPSFEVVRTTIVNLKYEQCDERICRPTIFGNPFVIGRDGTRDEVCDKYEVYFREKLKDPEFFNAVVKLKNKRLGCWCKEKDKKVRCHGDTIVSFLEKIP